MEHITPTFIFFAGMANKLIAILVIASVVLSIVLLQQFINGHLEEKAWWRNRVVIALGVCLVLLFITPNEYHIYRMIESQAKSQQSTK